MTTPNHIGLRVLFGRSGGEKTLGEIIKYNPSKAKVRTLEVRGVNNVRPAGIIWTVPYALMLTEDGRQVNQFGPVPFVHQGANGVQVVAVPPARHTAPLRKEFVPDVWDSVERNIVEAICGVHSQLSPENLTGDGERPRNQIRVIETQCRTRLRGLFLALGTELDELAAFEALEKYKAAELPRR